MGSLQPAEDNKSAQSLKQPHMNRDPLPAASFTKNVGVIKQKQQVGGQKSLKRNGTMHSYAAVAAKNLYVQEQRSTRTDPRLPQRHLSCYWVQLAPYHKPGVTSWL